MTEWTLAYIIIDIMRGMSSLECWFHEVERKEKEGQQQLTYNILSTMTIYGSWMHQSTRYISPGEETEGHI
jgi:hypothetical protein